MKVTYLGDKKNMTAHGYDFSGGVAEVPDTDKTAIEKFKGNRYFYVPEDGNHVAPKFYVYEIRMVALNNPRAERVRYRKASDMIVYGAQTEEECETWIRSNAGRKNVTHEIKPSKERIMDVPTEKKSKEIKLGIFRVKDDGEPYSRPDKTFAGTDEEELKAQALEFMADNDIDAEERILQVR